jgi:hypothetical protein
MLKLRSAAFVLHGEAFLLTLVEYVERVRL